MDLSQIQRLSVAQEHFDCEEGGSYLQSGMLSPGRTAIRPRKILLGVAFSLALLLSLNPSAALAHGGVAPDLAFWGPFGSGTVRCLRVISHATRRCFDQALKAQTDCAERQLAGQSCDTGARDVSIAAALAEATGVVDAACTGGQLTELRFAGFDDAKADVERACIGEADAVASLLYPATVIDAPSACRATASDLARKLVRYVSTGNRRALDRIAKRILSPSAKLALISGARTRAARAGEMCVGWLRRDCPAFDAIYGRSPEEWVEALAVRSDCVANATYFQTAVSCPFPECGNGIEERDEECDDGNGVDTDVCRNDCSRR
jgi:cysteine-rich repeat protein